MYIRCLDRFLAPLKENPDKVIGFRLTTKMNYAAGVLYLLPTKGLYNTLKNFGSWLNKENGIDNEFPKHCPEDWAITRSVAAINNFTLTQWDNAQNPENWLLSPFNYSELKSDGSISILSMTRFQLYDFVNFGNRH